MFSLRDFLIESNRIEGIVRDKVTLNAEKAIAEKFLGRIVLIKSDMVNLALALTNGYGELRKHSGMDVYVGNHVPWPGGPLIETQLEDIMKSAYKNQFNPEWAYKIHHQYETLHPFMDGNGRTGRLLWLWMMGGKAPLGFLHTFYYQSLEFGRSV